MKNSLVVFFLFILNLTSAQKLFEGELVYKHNMKVGSFDFTKSSKFFDTLRVVYKNKNYSKTKNKVSFEKEILIDSLQKTYLIYSERKKPERLYINEDNLYSGRLYKRRNSHFGEIISFEKRDTIFKLNDNEIPVQKLVLFRKYGNEEYVYNEQNNFKLSDDRNVLRNMGEQIHPDEIVSIINNSILYYYKLKISNSETLQEYILLELNPKIISDSEFKLPKHKDEKGFKKENKKDSRFKFYRVID
ncbi:hypothetical protein [uncultured Winogradskyella sp.]|uniref:hypothetical protein n=1 Tax=uncultured Winogradskyella sp. TaxID=395353 RepID=UPI00262F76BB|nr:hypothetical protein [uncultured Winogradskyella sp.]